MAKPQLSKQVTDHMKSVEAVAQAATMYRGMALDAFRERFGDDTAAAAGSLLDSAVTKMRTDCDAVVEADQALALERADDAAIVAQRDEAAGRLSAGVVQAREGVTVLVGREVLRGMGVVDSTPRDPVALVRLASTFVDGLGRATPQPSLIPNLTFEPATFVAMIQPHIAPAAEAISAFAADKRENETALVKRDRAFQLSISTFRVTAALVSALLEFAGETELAARVRPSGRNPGTITEEPQTESSEQPAA